MKLHFLTFSYPLPGSRVDPEVFPKRAANIKNPVDLLAGTLSLLVHRATIQSTYGELEVRKDRCPIGAECGPGYGV